MKAAVIMLAMVSCSTSATLHAGSTGIIQFRGLIVQETCAGSTAATRSAEAQPARDRCTLDAAGVGGARDIPLYSEYRTTVSGYSGIDLLDYYVDLARAHSNAQVQVLTRDYG